MRQTCPLCKSVLEVVSNFDLSAQPVQTIPCPVCGYPLYYSSGFPYSQTYRVSEVIEKKTPTQTWADVKAIPGSNAAAAENVGASSQPLWEKFGEQVTSDIKNVTGAAENRIMQYAIIAVVILGLVFFIQKKAMR
jgi:hypothetical protein